MLPIVSNQEEISMSSIEFLSEVINPARVFSGENETRYTDFIKRVIDELDLSQNDIFVLDNKGKGRNQHYANLDYDQMMLVGMRESKSVRKSVLSKLKELSTPKQPSWLASLSLEAQIAIADLDRQRLDAIATKAHINDKRTATLMNKASQDSKTIKKLESQLQSVGSYKSLTAVKIDKYILIGGKNKSVATIMKKLSIEMGLEVRKVEDSRYGFVNTYHVDVIEAFKSEYF